MLIDVLGRTGHRRMRTDTTKGQQGRQPAFGAMPCLFTNNFRKMPRKGLLHQKGTGTAGEFRRPVKRQSRGLGKPD